MEAPEPQEESCTLVQAVATYLEAHHASLLDQQPAPASLLLDMPVVELAAAQQHAEVVQALLEAPERLRQAAIAALSGAGLLAPGQHLWLRPRQLLAEAELGVRNALGTMRVAPGALFACHGVCVAASAPFQVPAARAFQCASCAKVCTIHSMEAPPPCCGGNLLEVETARVMVLAQAVFLADDAPLPGAPSTHLGGSVLELLLLDDLCGTVRVGDRVLATGTGRYYGGNAAAAAPGAHLPMTLNTLMEACNVEVLQPALLASPHELPRGARRHLAALSGGSLDALLSCLDAAAPDAAAAASPLLKLALLLSAAAAGTGRAELAGEAEEDPEPQAILRRRVAASRHQVNVMLTAAAPEPHIQRLLPALASGLADHSVRAAAADPRRLLPSLDARWVEPALGVPVPLAVGGQLGEAGAGLLLLSSSTLDTKRAIGLGQCMAAGEVALAQGCPELCVPVGATLWTMVHEQDLGKPTRAGGGDSSGLSLTERIINRFSQPFFAQHDIVLAAGPQTEEEADLLADAILLSAAAPAAAASQQACGDAAAALAHRVSAARAAPQPQLGEEAGALLAAYFSHLRTFEEAQAGVLASMVRVACAAARLRGSAVVQALPDAAVAIAFVEEKLLAAGASPLFWPRWREELQRCTELSECLRGLLEECRRGLSCGGCGSGAAGDGWAERPEE